MATKITQPMTGEAALAVSQDRSIKMHEFLMSGGVQQGYNADGIMQYGPPILAADTPECPWHSEPCAAWQAIRAGNGHWTKMEDELAGMKAMWAAGLDSKTLETQIAELEAKLADRPRDFKALRERTPEQFEAEREEHTRVYAAAPNKGKPGNPWNRGDRDKADYERGYKKVTGKTPKHTPYDANVSGYNANHPNPADYFKPEDQAFMSTEELTGLVVSETFDVTGEETD